MNERSGRKMWTDYKQEYKVGEITARFETGKKDTEEKWCKSKVGLVRNQE